MSDDLIAEARERSREGPDVTSQFVLRLADALEDAEKRVRELEGEVHELHMQAMEEIAESYSEGVAEGMALVRALLLDEMHCAHRLPLLERIPLGTGDRLAAERRIAQRVAGRMTEHHRKLFYHLYRG